MEKQQPSQKSPLDVAADLLVFAPVGLAIELGKHLPDLARQGRTHLEGPLSTAKFVGNLAAMQGRREFGDKFRKATEPFFGGPSGDTTSGDASTTVVRERADLPITGYDTLSATQIISHLPGLSDEELRQVKSYEETNRARRTVLNRIEQLLDA